MALAFFLMATVMFTVRQRSDAVLLSHALEVEVDLGEVKGALADAEAGQRGYLLTGDATFLSPYREASRKIDSLMDQLGDAVQNDPDQAGAFAELTTIVVGKRAELARSLALHTAGDAAGALNLVKDKSGVSMMDRIRTIVEEMDAEQDRLVSERQGGVHRIGIIATTFTGISLVMMLLVGVAALNEVYRSARLARFLPAEIATRLADDDSGLREGRSGSAVVAFVDIRGSTAIAETLTPAALSRLLTGFRATVSVAARQHGGMVDKFIGDGALVVFGALDEDPDAAARSLAFARALLGETTNDPELPSAGSAPDAVAFHLGVGIHCGDVFCGIVGTEDRREFTVVGDAVNVASRIERATRTFGVALLVSDAVLARAGEDLARWDEISREPLRGHSGVVTIYAERTQPA